MNIDFPSRMGSPPDNIGPILSVSSEHSCRAVIWLFCRGTGWRRSRLKSGSLSNSLSSSHGRQLLDRVTPDV